MRLRLFCVVLIALSALPVAAEKVDRDKPMNVEADALRHDDLKQTSVFTGNVHITKGTIIVRGAQVEVRQNPQGYQFATVFGSPDKLAFYRRKRDQGDEYIEGEAETIEYDSQTDTVKFIKRAVMRRYKGAAIADETAGALIVYDSLTDIFTVDAGAKTRTPGNPGGRVRAVLAPRNNASEPSSKAPTP